MLTSLLGASFAQGVTLYLLFLIPKMGIIIMIASELVEYVARPSKCSPSPWKALNRNLLLLLSLVKGRGPKPMVERRLPHAGQELHGRG